MRFSFCVSYKRYTWLWRGQPTRTHFLVLGSNFLHSSFGILECERKRQMQTLNVFYLWFVTIPGFIWCHPNEIPLFFVYTAACTAFARKVWEFGIYRHGMCTFNETAVELFNNAILLWGLVYCRLMTSSYLYQEDLTLFGDIFTSIIRTELLPVAASTSAFRCRKLPNT